MAKGQTPSAPKQWKSEVHFEGWSLSVLAQEQEFFREHSNMKAQVSLCQSTDGLSTSKLANFEGAAKDFSTLLD